MTVTSKMIGNTLVVTHSRPDVRNAMDTQSAEALYDAMLAFDQNADAHVAILYGDGGAFCAGWDLKYAATLADRNRYESDIVKPLAFPDDGSPVPRAPMGPSRLELSKPVIAAVEGPAVAGGMELAMWCDIRILAQDAYFGVYCRRWGIPFVDGGTVRLPRLVGQGRALEILLTGRKVSADEALRIGLCERVVESGSALTEAMSMAEQIARFPQAALRADRMSARHSFDLPLQDALRQEWHNGIEAHFAEGANGAAQFAAGQGRHGKFDSN